MKFTGIYRGKVLATDAAEDDKLGRVKLEIYPMLISSDAVNGSAARLKAAGSDIEGIPIAQLPWATPAMPLFSGAGNGYGAFVVPDIGSFVWTFFEGDDVYQPVYFAEAQTKTFGIPSEALVNYPTRRVHKTQNGIIIEIDDTEGSEEIKITHPAGTTFQVTSEGNLVVTSAGTTTITSTGNLSVDAPRIDLN